MLCHRRRSNRRAEHFIAENGGSVGSISCEKTVAAFGMRERCMEMCTAIGDYAQRRDQSHQRRILSDTSGRFA